MADRRAMISTEELERILNKVLDDRHQCHFDPDDVHDLKELLKIYRETTSTFRKIIIRGFVIGIFALAAALLGIKNGWWKG